MNEDMIDRVVRETAQAWPERDASSEEVVLRILMAGHFMAQEMEYGLLEFDLNPGEFGVLIELRLTGSPYRLTPTQLYNRLLVTSGGMTGRIDKLEKRGLVRRVPDPSDRRSVLVEITDSGLELINEAVKSQHGVEDHLVEGLTIDERQQLAPILRKLLMDIESHDCCNAPRKRS